MDYFVLNPKAPATSCSGWLLGSEYERQTSGFAKASSGVMKLGNVSTSMNLGIMWTKRHCPLLKEAENKARALWKGETQALVWAAHRERLS